MMSTTISNPMIENYFSELEKKMSGCSKAEREEFIREIRAHVLDRLLQTAAPTEEGCRAVLAAVGTPEEVARHYRLELMLNRAAKSRSPLLLLRSTLRWAVTGVQGFAVFLVACVGYMLALGLYVLAVLKPIFPHNVGMFVGPRGMDIAYMSHPRGQEVLGPYFTLVMMFAGLFLMQGTTLLLRFLINRFGKLKQKIWL